MSEIYIIIFNWFIVFINLLKYRMFKVYSMLITLFENNNPFNGI